MHINSIAWRTWSWHLCNTICEWLSPEFSSHVIVWYDFSIKKKSYIDSLFYTKDNIIYTYLYKFFVWLNFLFDYMRPWHLSYKKLSRNNHYKECDIVHIHCLEWWHFNWKDLPIICKEKKVVIIISWWLASWKDPNNYFFWKWEKSFNTRMKVLENLDIVYVWMSDWINNSTKHYCKLKNIVKIANGINTNIFHQKNKIELREKYNIPKNKKISISIAGSWSKSKLKWIDYVEKIIDVYASQDMLFITIWNSESKKISDKHREIGLVTQSEMADYYSMADVFLYPTQADNCPLTILESISCKCPIVSFAIEWVPELITHKLNWFLAEPNSINDLIAWLNRALNDWPHFFTLDSLYTQESMINQYESIYKWLLKK